MHNLKIYSHNEKKNILFTPKGKINLYVCGPTVYNRMHIGNARTFIFFDVVFRILKFLYEEVIYVRNITDLDDKIEERSIKENVSPKSIVTKYINYFAEDMAFLNCLTPSYEPKATENITNIIVMIQTLLKEGFAYEINGNVYFSVKKYYKYFDIFKNIVNSSDIYNTGINIDKEVKQNSKDFILWKSIENEYEKRKYKNGYDSPFGQGRPGWHIECSAMSIKYFHDKIDIHGGGLDLMFPHHVNEVAQSESYLPSFKVCHWMHVNLIKIHNQKMGKSLHNVINIEELSKKYSADAIRFFLLNNHYRNEIDFSYKILDDAEKYINSIFLYCYGEINIGSIPQFVLDIINNDFNFSILFNKINELIKLDMEEVKPKYVLAIFKLLGFKFVQDVFQDRIPEEVMTLLYMREVDRKNKHWEAADHKRIIIQDYGYMIFDLSEKTILRSK